MLQRRALAVISATVAVASVIGAACADLTASGTNETLAPLVPDRSGPPITQVPAVGPNGQPVVNTQGSTTTLPREQAAAELAADDTDALSVAARFLSAAAAGDDATATALEVPGRSPTTAEWARAAFAEFTQVAGAEVWGEPTCSDPAGPTISCSWLQTEAPPTLILVQQDGNWLVSHPLFNVAAAPQPAGERLHRRIGQRQRPRRAGYELAAVRPAPPGDLFRAGVRLRPHRLEQRRPVADDRGRRAARHGSSSASSTCDSPRR